MSKRKRRRRNPKRAANPGALVTTLICSGAALASITLVTIAMQARYNTAITLCGRLGGLPDAEAA